MGVVGVGGVEGAGRGTLNDVIFGINFFLRSVKPEN